ncbi:MAG TPA: hypothetical protein ENJ00_10100 [Phycisphaerales bacterium]|nr:hypothetical protein [Phycisphaerales bacterium]
MGFVTAESGQSFAQDSSFEPRPPVVTGLTGVQTVHAADLDLDGDQDILVGTGLQGELIWFENDGDLVPSHPVSHTVDAQIADAREATTADLDGDGDLDILAAVRSGDTQLLWYENTGGLPPVFVARVFGSLNPGDIGGRVNSARAADLDGDGDLDIVLAFYINSLQSQGYVTWYENDGGVLPSFTAHLLSAPPNTLNNVREIEIGDLDADGSPDIAAISESPGTPGGQNRVVWWQSDGAANPSFTMQDIDIALVDPTALRLGQFNTDTALDLIVSSSTSNSISLFLNNGMSNPSFIVQLGVANIQDPRALDVQDFDGDGDLDFIACSGTGQNVIVFQSDGAANPSFLPRPLGPMSGFCGDTVFGDMDSDGDADALAVFPGSGTVGWFRHVLPIRNITSGTTHPSFTDAIQSASSGDTLQADPERFMDDPVIDFSGKSLDIQSLGGLTMSDGASVTFAPGSALTSSPGDPIILDGQMSLPPATNLSMASDSGIIVRSSLAATTGSSINFTSGLIVSGSREHSRQVIDGDNALGSFMHLIDRPVDLKTIPPIDGGLIAFAAIGDSVGGPGQPTPAGLAVYVQDPLSATGWTASAIDAAVDARHSTLAVADFTGDGASDIVTIRDAGVGPELRLHTNLSTLSPTFISSTVATGQEASQLVPADLDHDGDMDIVTGQGWFRSSGGSSPTFSFVPFPAIVSLESFGVVVGDLDLDGDRDVVVHSEYRRPGIPGRVGYRLYLLDSDGQPNPGFTPIILTELDLVASGVCSGDTDCYPQSNVELDGLNTLSREDLNHDGLTDIFMSEDAGITLFTNLGTSGSFAKTTLASECRFSALIPIDFDGDHDIDLICASQQAGRIQVLSNDGAGTLTPSDAIRPILRAHGLAVLSSDELGVADLVICGTGFDRIEHIAYTSLPVFTVENGSQASVNGMLLTERATISLLGGQLDALGPVVVSPDHGKLVGNGTVNADVENAGVVDPRGLLVLGNNYFQRSPFYPGFFGRLDIDIRSESPLDVDTLAVMNTASLGGGLVVTSDPTFQATQGTNLPVVLASDLDDAATTFDVVHSPAVAVNTGGGMIQPGSYMPSYSDSPPLSGIELFPLPVPDPSINRQGFDAIAKPADAVIADFAGGPSGNGDGLMDTAVAYPDLPGLTQGGVAVFVGGNGKNRYDFSGVSIYTGANAANPVAVEAGDFDGNGTVELAFANSAPDGNISGVFLLGVNTNLQVPVFDSQIPGISFLRNVRITDLATGDFQEAGGGLNGGGANRLPGSTSIVVLNDQEDNGMATIAEFNGLSWDTCDIDVCDDPDSVDPIDVDGSLAVLIDGICTTSFDDDKVTVSVNEAASPGTYTSTSYAVGDGPTEIRADDMNNDGFPDIVVINETDGTVSILENIEDLTALGGRNFADQIVLPLQADPGDPDPLPSSVALADLDDDGDLDIAVVSTNATGVRTVRQLQSLFVETGELTFESVADLPDQPDGVPLLVRESDLNGDSGGTMLNDDLVVYIDPTASPLPAGRSTGRILGPMPMHESFLSGNTAVCLPDINGDGMLNSADFTAWIAAYNAGDPAADQNGDGLITPSDFSAWIVNFNAGC